MNDIVSQGYIHVPTWSVRFDFWFKKKTSFSSESRMPVLAFVHVGSTVTFFFDTGLFLVSFETKVSKNLALWSGSDVS